MKYVQKGVPRALFGEVAARGALFSYPHFSFRVVLNKRDDKIFRFSFVVSSKVANKAVLRNLLRRRGKAIVREALTASASKPCAGIFYAGKGASGISYDAVKSEIVFLLKKATIIQ
jgi:ribonuclease P protein component